jgi:hypothetical protein
MAQLPLSHYWPVQKVRAEFVKLWRPDAMSANSIFDVHIKTTIGALQSMAGMPTAMLSCPET